MYTGVVCGLDQESGLWIRLQEWCVDQIRRVVCGLDLNSSLQIRLEEKIVDYMGGVVSGS